MRHNGTVDTRFKKELARKKYAERQFDKWVKWSIAQKGYVLFKEVIEKQIEYKIQDNVKQSKYSPNKTT
jgi:hypothetical protein